ncbi:hypothetical protein ACFYSC_20790 [Streptosporangium sp. NPDC004379]|uniref:hypothetical protein n=1 Tax=Streptosporangium sp. NPDC004379 TaxID=3366189 RepID=UPI0036A5EA02
MPCASAHAFLRVNGTRSCRPFPPQVTDDDQLLILLVTTWALTTGRIPPNRPSDRLTREELIEFWADEHTAGTVPAPPQE